MGKWRPLEERRIERTCGHCGASCKVRYCSRQCAGARRKTRQATCRGCGVTYRPKASNRRAYCSRDCAFKHKAAKSPAPKHCADCRAEIPRRRIRCVPCVVEARRLASRVPRVERTCEDCHTTYIPTHGQRKRYCSMLCAKRVSRRIEKAKRRAREAQLPTENINPFKVFTRDSWTCRMCHEPTPRALRGTLDNHAPELDHIVPLSRGGPHTYSNTQCLCRRCNQVKGAQPVAA